MKKVLSRIIAIALAVILFSAPSAVQAETSGLTLVYNTGNFKMYQYLPDSLHLLKNDDTSLPDLTTSDWNWHVPAGKNFTISCNFKQACDFTYLVSVNNQLYTLTDLKNRGYFDLMLPALPTDSVVRVVLIAATDNVYIDSYYGLLN